MPDWKQHRYRRATLRRTGTFDREARTVEAVIATSDWIDGPFGRERLVMAPSAVDMSRASPSMAWHDDHGPGAGPSGRGERIGVAEDVRLDGETLTATLRASRNAPGEAALQDIEDGIITHTSIGYRVDDARPTDDGLLITRWTPMEVSTPSIVADPAAIIQRTAHMPDDNVNPDLAPEDPTPPVAPVTKAIEKARVEGQRAAAESFQALDKTFAPYPRAGHLRTRAIAEGWTVERANSALLDWLGAQYQPHGRGIDAVAGDDEMDKFVRAASSALQTRALLIIGDEARTVRRDNEFFGFSLRELAREYLRRAGDDVRGDSNVIVGKALTRAGIISHTTSDFANLLVDASNKALQMGYEEAPETYEPWTRPGTLPDFKTGHRPKLSTFSDLAQVGENGEITYGSFSDYKETIALLAYAKLFSITRISIINDDLSAFTDAPRGLARAARRLVGDLVYSVLSTNGNMSDGNALFDATNHSNYVAGGSGAAPSVTTLNTAYASMATQTDPGGATLNITPQFILAPHALRGTVDALLASSLNPAEGGTTSFQEDNTWRARLTPVYDARIDADDAAKWYLAAPPNAFDTLEVAYLNGVQEPRLEREEGFTIDGVTLKVAHDVGVAPLDWRGLYHNDGN